MLPNESTEANQVQNEPSAEVHYRIEHDAPAAVTKKEYKFFRLSALSARDEAQFNKDFQGWEYVGMTDYGGGVVVLGVRENHVTPKPVSEVEPPEEKPHAPPVVTELGNEDSPANKKLNPF